MEKNHSHFYHLQFAFFVSLILLSALMLFLLLKPFLGVLVFSMALAVVFYPIHKKILVFFSGSERSASVVSVTIILFLILVPLIFVGISLFQEITNIYLDLESKGGFSYKINEFFFSFQEFLNSKWPNLSINISRHVVLSDYINQGFSWVLHNTSAIFSSFVKWFFNLFLMILALFYLFKDGKKLRDTFISLSPLSPEYSRRVLTKVQSAINSVIRGRLFVGVVQGVSVMLSFIIFSVPNPIFWGAVSAVFSILPVIGPFFIFVPASVYMYVTFGSFIPAIGLIAWGIISVTVLDDYLSAILIDKSVKIHPFLILISALGGLILFGPLGFILGPISLSLFFALLDIYPTIVLKE